MKIKDVVVEGFWNGLGAVAKGIGQGVADVVAPGAVDNLSKSFRQANAARQGQKGASKPGNILYKGNEYQWLGQQWGLLNPATGKAVPAPKAIQQQLNFMATRKKPNFSNMSIEELGDYATTSATATTYGQDLRAEFAKRIATMSDEELMGYAETGAGRKTFTQEIKNEIAKRQQKQQPTNQQPNNQQPTADTPSMVGKYGKSGQRSNQEQPQTGQAAAGVTLVNREPIIIKYQGKDYGLNDRGAWVSQKTGKQPPEATASFLDQQAEALTGATFTPKTSSSQPTATNNPDIIGRVDTPAGEAVKWRDGVWTIPATSEEIVKPNDLKKLEELLKQQASA